jgi:hypothetical protein
MPYLAARTHSTWSAQNERKSEIQSWICNFLANLSAHPSQEFKFRERHHAQHAIPEALKRAFWYAENLLYNTKAQKTMDIDREYG